MTNYDELAQRVNAMGFGLADVSDDTTEVCGGPLYCIPDSVAWCDAEAFIKDGRTVLALMERCRSIHAFWDDTGWSCNASTSFRNGVYDGMVQRSPASVAIVTACLDALEGE